MRFDMKSCSRSTKQVIMVCQIKNPIILSQKRLCRSQGTRLKCSCVFCRCEETELVLIQAAEASLANVFYLYCRTEIYGRRRWKVQSRDV